MENVQTLSTFLDTKILKYKQHKQNVWQTSKSVSWKSLFTYLVQNHGFVVFEWFIHVVFPTYLNLVPTSDIFSWYHVAVLGQQRGFSLFTKDW